ncbi:diacylglycerol kinase family protein [Lyngbya confervoides]|uniref:Diacylglycerol kinase family protein n=1 Tax=Lyngbya confervoides BDU141951 TaxID=1574623 RepID=A0ABD4T4G0_9CYAN|nr:diacylglycerol kinase family protein [Lyngbya confervoides]MCM1983321.1 diacylglycerol kinase family protein [Lyngbya confervoides BDU141951]
MTEKLIASPPPVLKRPSRPYREPRERAYKVAHNLLVSFRYAGAGLVYAFFTQRNFRIHALVGTLAMSLGLLLEVSNVELAVIALTSALVMAMELINTALEAVVDLTVGSDFHELAKIAKDCAAAAVLMLAIAALTIAGFLLLPPLLNDL